MKDTRNREEKQDAVSAVIGVIIMVAITIAMAAVAYAYFTGMIGNPQEEVPIIEFIPNENLDQIQISSTDDGVQWEDLAIRSTAAVTIYVNGEVTAVLGTPITANTLTTFTDAMIATGDASITLDPSDYIDIEGTTASLEDVTITIVHVESGSTISIFDFATIAQRAD